jgi:HEAT repeat protein
MHTLPRPFSLLVALLLFLTLPGCQQVRRATNYFRGETPGKDARLMEDTASPDNRRRGIYALVENDFAQKEPYTTRYRQIVQSDESAAVRAAALRALNVSRDTGAADLYLKALADPDPQIRLEGAKALANMPNPDATDALLRVLNAPEEDQDVRIAAASALKYYPRRDVARALVAQLDQRTFGVAWEARRSLRQITGADYAYDNAAWLEYISNPANPLG